MHPNDIQVEGLTRQHQRDAFTCGEPLLDDWLKFFAGQFERRDLARTYVAVVAGEKRVLGYYAIAAHAASREQLPPTESKHLPQIDLPVILRGRLAVDRSLHGRRIGELLLLDALRRCGKIADELGTRAVEVYAISNLARNFYGKFGFIELLDDPNHLLLPMSEIRKLGRK